MLINGRLYRVIGGGTGSGETLAEIGVIEDGQPKKLWPPEGFCRKIVVELPQPGTLDYLYWQHALKALQSGRPNSYMYIPDDRINYYIMKSKDISTPYRLNGDELTIDYDGLPQSSITSECLTVRADIAGWTAPGQGYGCARNDYPENNEQPFSTYYWDYPLIPNTKFMADWGIGRKKHAGSFYIVIKGQPSGTQYFKTLHWNPHGWKGRFAHFDCEVMKVGSKPNMVDTSVRLDLSSRFEGTVVDKHIGGKGFRPVFPSFSRIFKLKIISVE